MKKSLYIKILFNDARTYLGMWDGRVAVTKDMNPRKNKKAIKRSTCKSHCYCTNSVIGIIVIMIDVVIVEMK